METSENSGRGQSEGSKSTQFRPGHPGRKRGGKKSRPPSQLLRDMRAVYSQDESKDRTPGQKLCRNILKDDPNRFFAQLAKLESSHEAGAAKAKVAKGPVPVTEQEVGPGTERCLRLAKNLLGEILADQAKEDARLATRPDAAQIAGTLQTRLTAVLERELKLKERVKQLEMVVAAAKASA